VLAHRLRELGFEDLESYLRHAQTTGISLRSVCKTTRLGWARLRRELQAGGITARSATRSSVQLCGGRQVAAEAALQDKSHYWKNVADYTLPDLPYDYVLWNPTSLGRSWNCTTPNTTPPESRVLIPR
jgi:hypothetical protein